MASKEDWKSACEARGFATEPLERLIRYGRDNESTFLALIRFVLDTGPVPAELRDADPEAIDDAVRPLLKAVRDDEVARERALSVLFASPECWESRKDDLIAGLLESTATRDACDRVVALLEALGATDIELALADHMRLTTDSITSFGQWVLGQPVATTIEQHTAVEGMLGVAELFMMAGRFDEVREAVVGYVEGNPGRTAMLVGITSEHGGDALAPFAIELAEGLLGHDHTIASMIAACALVAYDDRAADLRWALAERAATAVFAAEKPVWHLPPPYVPAERAWSDKITVAAWLVEHEGVRAKKLLRKYKEKNYAFLISALYPRVAKHMGQDGVDILVTALTKRLGASVRGFVSHGSYYRKLFALIEPFTLTKKQEERIRKAFSKQKDPSIRKLAERFFDPDPVTKRKVALPKKRFAFDQCADAAMTACAKAAKKLAKGDAVGGVELFFDPEDDEDAIVAISVTVGEKTRRAKLSARMKKDGDLRELEKKYDIDTDAIRLGDSAVLPGLVMWHELRRVVAELPEAMRSAGVAMEPSFTVSCEAIESFYATESGLRRAMADAFSDNATVRAFVATCYEDPARRVWLESLAKPRVRYELQCDWWATSVS